MNHYENEIDGWFDPAFAAVYESAVAAAKDGDTFVELGCWKGKSLSYLLVEAANSGKKLSIYGVDHFKGNAENPAMQHEASCIDLERVCKENANRSGYSYSLWVKSSPEAADGFSDGEVTFVFIDASHDQASVSADIKAWLPKVKPGGVLAGHDVGYSGVASAVIELLPGWETRGSCWLYKVPKLEKTLDLRGVDTLPKQEPPPIELLKPPAPLVTPKKSNRGKRYV